MEVNVIVQRKISNVLINDVDKYNREFARLLATNGFSVKQAYHKAYDKITKIRASYLLEDPMVWKYYFDELNLKQNLTSEEARHLENYNMITDTFIMDPFSLYSFYVDVKPDMEGPISSVISSDLAKDFQVLIHLHFFFENLKRTYFLRKIQARIAIEHDQVKRTCEEKQYQRLFKLCQKYEVDLEDICKPQLKAVQTELPL